MSDIKSILESTRQGMQKALQHLDVELTKLRAGKASPNMLETVKVPAYGSQMKMSEVANVTTPDARTLQVDPFDKGLMKAIEQAIRDAGLNFNPMNDGKVVRITVPPPSEQRRKELVKLAKEEGETAKVSIRNLRREGMERMKKLKDAGVPEDSIKAGEKDVQKITDDSIAKVDEVIKAKEKEIMTI
jgi:ribosome recycling factor